MRNMRRAAAVRRRAVRVNRRRATGMRRVTRAAVVKMRAVRMRPELPETKRRSLVVMLTRRMMLTLMMRTEDRPVVAVTMIRTVAVIGVASGAAARAEVAAAVPAPSPVAVSTQPKRMAVKPQLLSPVRLTATATEPWGFRRGPE